MAGEDERGWPCTGRQHLQRASGQARQHGCGTGLQGLVTIRCCPGCLHLQCRCMWLAMPPLAAPSAPDPRSPACQNTCEGSPAAPAPAAAASAAMSGGAQERSACALLVCNSITAALVMALKLRTATGSGRAPAGAASAQQAASSWPAMRQHPQHKRLGPKHQHDGWCGNRHPKKQLTFSSGMVATMVSRAAVPPTSPFSPLLGGAPRQRA